MFVGITNTPRDYAWGSRGAISELLGLGETDALEAELWLGAHPGSPSRIVDPSQTSGATDLAAWIASDPGTALGDPAASHLPFLLKILAAEAPLSLQAHPTAKQARRGFARENSTGVPLAAAHRNYKDPYPKPELIYALSETFEALCGFRSAVEVRKSIIRLLELDAASTQPDPEPLQLWLEKTIYDGSIRGVFEWLISQGDGVHVLVDRVVSIARANPEELATVVMLAEAYPGDPGIVISLLLHRVTLTRGEALYLPAGNIHAYLSGLGVELMGASDNVLRGGLTPKHIDVPELIEVLDFQPVSVPYLRPEMPQPGTEIYRPDVPDFLLERIVDDGVCSLSGPAILLCVEGSLHVAGAESTIDLTRGNCVFVTPAEDNLTVTGRGTVFVATGGN